MSPPIPTTPDRSLRRVVWLTAALFLSYLCVAMALPVTSVVVTTRLGFGNALAGLAVGIAFAATIFTRGVAGRIADRRGGKHAMVRGLWVYGAAGLVCAAEGWPGLSAGAVYAVLLAGRLLLRWGGELGHGRAHRLGAGGHAKRLHEIIPTSARHLLPDPLAQRLT